MRVTKSGTTNEHFKDEVATAHGRGGESRGAHCEIRVWVVAPADLGGGGAAALLLLRGLVGELQRDDLVHDVFSVVHDGVAHVQHAFDCAFVIRLRFCTRK